MQASKETPGLSLQQLPDIALLNILRHLDGKSLAYLEQSSPDFTRKDPVTKLPFLEHIARERVLASCCNDMEAATRFRNMSWKERLHVEVATGCGFDREWCEAAGFSFHHDKHAGGGPPSVRLNGMGPKLLLSDRSTADQSSLRWRLRLRGNTAVEFGALPVDLPPCHTALHKCMAVPGAPDQNAVGFCSQITAGSLLPLKAPIMRGTLLDVMVRRGRLSAVLHYPPDAKEIAWQNGQPIHRPYRGPTQLRFEQDFDASYDVRLAVTAWAKASFEVLNAGHEIHSYRWDEKPSVAEEEQHGRTSIEAEDPSPSPVSSQSMGCMEDLSLAGQSVTSIGSAELEEIGKNGENMESESTRDASSISVLLHGTTLRGAACPMHSGELQMEQTMSSSCC